MKQRTSALRIKYQLYKSEDNKSAYQASAKDFHRAILQLKHEHWKTDLVELDDKSLFTAGRFTNGPTPPSIVPPLRHPDGHLTSDPAEQAHLLFTSTSAPTIDIDLSNIAKPTRRVRKSPPFTITEAGTVIVGLSQANPQQSPTARWTSSHIMHDQHRQRKRRLRPLPCSMETP